MIQKQTLLNIGIFTLIGMASTCGAVAWFGATQLPQRECTATELVQTKLFDEQMAQDLQTETLHPHGPVPFCYAQGKHLTPAEYYAEIGKGITQTPGLALSNFLVVSAIFGGIAYGAWNMLHGLMWAFKWLITRFTDSVAAHAESV